MGIDDGNKRGWWCGAHLLDAVTDARKLIGEVLAAGIGPETRENEV